MAKHLKCGDVVDGCEFEATAATEEDLLAKVAAHARETHHIDEISPDLAAKVKAAIKDR